MTSGPTRAKLLRGWDDERWQIVEGKKKMLLGRHRNRRNENKRKTLRTHREGR